MVDVIDAAIRAPDPGQDGTRESDETETRANARDPAVDLNLETTDADATTLDLGLARRHLSDAMKDLARENEAGPSPEKEVRMEIPKMERTDLPKETVDQGQKKIEVYRHNLIEKTKSRTNTIRLMMIVLVSMGMMMIM